MTTDRCPACGAAVSAGAPWCTLCYFDLRPRRHEPQPEPRQVSLPVPVAAAVAAAPAQVMAAALPPDPILDAPVVAAAPIVGREMAFWPCAGCGARVPMSDDTCTTCGASFLPSDPTPSLNLPGVGNVARLDNAQRIGLMIGGVFVVMALFMLVSFVLGSIL